MSAMPIAGGAAPINTDDVPTVVSHRRQALIGEDLRGRRLAHFDVIEPIGSGGMGAVWKATDLSLDRYVALKILPPDVADDAEHLGRFRQEARAAARLDHEHVARVHFCGEAAAFHFIAFEFVEGRDLRTMLECDGPIDVTSAVKYLVQVANGLAHAAERGVIHRDVKPSNIIITNDGRAKIVDMGLARLEGPTDALTHSGATLGTYDYVSPEQAMDPRTADVRSDIYSLGCTFYHVLTGQSPVPAGTAAKKLEAHRHQKPADPRTHNPEIPEQVVVILSKMMAKCPDDRYASMHALVTDVQGLLTESTSQSRTITTKNSIRRRGVPWPIALSALAGIVVWVLLAEVNPAGQRRRAKSQTAFFEKSSGSENEDSLGESFNTEERGISPNKK